MLTPQQAANPDADTFQRLFEEDYAKLFGRAVDGMDIEITVWAVNATTPRRSLFRPLNRPAPSAMPPIAGTREVFDPALARAVVRRCGRPRQPENRAIRSAAPP